MKPLLVVVFLLLCSQSIAQTKRLDDLCQVFHLPDGKDTTAFVVFGSKADLNVKKPLFLFRQGSQPAPFIHLVGDNYYFSSPFHFRDYKDEYHFVMIQKPGVQLVVDTTFFNAYVKAINQPEPPEKFVSRKYLTNNYRERYVDQCNTDKQFGDTYRAWYSFSQPTLPNLLAISTPLYIAYGTADKEMARSLDDLPLEFIARGKKNLTLKPYDDHDHQFFRLKRDKTGQVIDKEYNGDAVAKD